MNTEQAAYISSYTRADAMADGFLVDVTEWASNKTGFSGGFTIPVAVTKAVYDLIEAIPARHAFQDVRGRAHDVLFMASLAARKNAAGNQVVFSAILSVGDEAIHDDVQNFVMHVHGGDQGEPVITISLPDEAL